MNAPNSEMDSTAAAPRALRIWPALVLLGLVVTSQLLPLLVSDFSLVVFLLYLATPLLAGIGLMLWWALASRATGRERWLGPLAVLAIGAACWVLLHPSVRAFPGATLYLLYLPSGLLAAGLTLVVLYRARSSLRLRAAVIAALVGFVGWSLVRSEGISGDFKIKFAWRWTPTAEELYLAKLKHESPNTSKSQDTSAEHAALEQPDWPGFRGAKRDGAVPGVTLTVDWQAHPPKEIWRRSVGPGWSSFAVAGHSLFTQEQRGDVEVVVCYDADTGAERWAHESRARFWESSSGAGPRATPTLALGRLYSAGATGLLHCLDPSSGKVLWQRDLTKDAMREPPMWGFSSSPLVVGDLVIVYAGGTDDKGLFAYDTITGEQRWSAAAGDQCYSSPHLASVAGKDVVLMFTNLSLTALDPNSGTVLWSYVLEKQTSEGSNCLQPLVVSPSAILYGTGLDTRRLDLTLSEDAPQPKRSWISASMKPTYNDYVAHRGSLYGFDGNIFACIDLETGKRNWKKGRYGNGQVLLLPDADQLLVTGETGEVVLLRASDQGLEELANVKVLSGKTWNHAALVAPRLYLRNGEEAVCLELPLRMP